MDNKLLKIAAYSLLAMAIMSAISLILGFGVVKLAAEKTENYITHTHYLHFMNPFNMEQRMKETFDEIGVTPEQKQKLDDVLESARKEKEPIINSMIEKKKELMNYIMTPEATEEKALEMKDEIAKLHQEIGKIHIKTVFEIKKILTPEQFEKFSMHLKNHIEEFEHMFRHKNDKEDHDED